MTKETLINKWWETYRDYMINCGVSDLNEILVAWNERTQGLIEHFNNTETYADSFASFLKYQTDIYVGLNDYHKRFGHVPIESVKHPRPGNRWLA